MKALGAMTGSARTPAQEAVAQFYNLNPVELFNRTFRTLAVEQKLTLAEQARLFAMLGLTNADSLITCWADKGTGTSGARAPRSSRGRPTATRTPPATRRGRRSCPTPPTRTTRPGTTA